MDSATDGLTIVDPITGVVTPVGPLGAPGEFPVPTSLATDPTTGTLYTWNNKSGVNGLVVVDPTTGAGAHVNPGGPSPNKNFGSLAFSPDGALYGLSGGIWSIDLLTSQITELALGNFLPDLSGADYGPNGLLYGTTSSGLLYRDISVLDGTWASTVEMALNGEDLDTQLQTIVFTPTGGLLAAGHRWAQFTLRQYVFHESPIPHVELDGQPPGYSGDAVDPYTGYQYFFDADGIIDSVVDDLGNPVGADHTPTTPLLEAMVETEPSRQILFDIDPVTGVVSTLLDISGGNMPQGLAFIPEPSSGLLLLAQASRGSQRAKAGV